MSKPLIASHLIDGLATAQQQRTVPSRWGKFHVNARIILSLSFLPLLVLVPGILLGVLFGDWENLFTFTFAWLFIGGFLLTLMLIAGIVGAIRGQNGNPDHLLLRSHATVTLLAALHAPDDTLLPIFVNELTVPNSGDLNRHPIGPLRGLQMAPPSQNLWDPFLMYSIFIVLILQMVAMNFREIQDNSILETATQHAMRFAQFDWQDFFSGVALIMILLINLLNLEPVEKQAEESQRSYPERMTTTSYASDLTDGQWEIRKPFFPVATTGRPRQYPYRTFINAIRYLLRSGSQWRLLPQEFPP